MFNLQEGGLADELDAEHQSVIAALAVHNPPDSAQRAGANLHLSSSLERLATFKDQAGLEGEAKGGEFSVEAVLVGDFDDLCDMAGAIGGEGGIAIALEEAVAGEQGQIDDEFTLAVVPRNSLQRKEIRNSHPLEVFGEDFLLAALGAKDPPERGRGGAGEGAG